MLECIPVSSLLFLFQSTGLIQWGFTPPGSQFPLNWHFGSFRERFIWTISVLTISLIFLRRKWSSFVAIQIKRYLIKQKASVLVKHVLDVGLCGPTQHINRSRISSIPEMLGWFIWDIREISPFKNFVYGITLKWATLWEWDIMAFFKVMLFSGNLHRQREKIYFIISYFYDIDIDR